MSVNGNPMPPLAAEELAALRRSIAEHGLREPIVRDDDTGAVLDGHHRLAVCRELDIEPRFDDRRFADERARREYAITANVVRRQLGPIAWARAFQALLSCAASNAAKAPATTQPRQPLPKWPLTSACPNAPPVGGCGSPTGWRDTPSSPRRSTTAK